MTAPSVTIDSTSEPTPDIIGTPRLYHSLVLAVCIGIVVSSFLLKITGEMVSLGGVENPARCFLYHCLSVKCEFCGMTRSFIHTAHGDLATARLLHPLGPTLFLYICLQIPYRIIAITISPRRVDPRVVRLGWITCLVIVAAIITRWLIYAGGLLI